MNSNTTPQKSYFIIDLVCVTGGNEIKSQLGLEPRSSDVALPLSL